MPGSGRCSKCSGRCTVSHAINSIDIDKTNNLGRISETIFYKRGYTRNQNGHCGKIDLVETSPWTHRSVLVCTLAVVENYQLPVPGIIDINIDIGLLF